MLNEMILRDDTTGQQLAYVLAVGLTQQRRGETCRLGNRFDALSLFINLLTCFGDNGLMRDELCGHLLAEQTRVWNPLMFQATLPSAGWWGHLPPSGRGPDLIETMIASRLIRARRAEVLLCIRYEKAGRTPPYSTCPAFQALRNRKGNDSEIGARRMLWRLSYSTIGDVLSFVNTHRALGLCTQACRGWRDVASSLITQRYSIESNKVDAVLSLILHISNRMKRSFTTVMPRPSLESWFIQVENSYCPDVEFDDARLQKLATVAHLSPIKSLEWLTQYGLAQYVPFCDSRPCTKRLVLLAVELPTVMVDGSTFGDFGAA